MNILSEEVQAAKRRAYWESDVSYPTKKTRIVLENNRTDIVNMSCVSSKKSRVRTTGYQQLYAELKFYKKTLQFHASLVCDSAQGRCGFMKRLSRPPGIDGDPNKNSHGDSAYDSSYGSSEAQLSQAAHHMYPNARDVITRTNGDTAFFKFSVKSETHTMGFYEWLVSKSMMLRCSFIPNFMRPYTYTKNTLVINHFRDSDDDPASGSSDENGSGECGGDYVDESSLRSCRYPGPGRKLRIKRKKIDINRDDDDYLVTDINPFEVNTENARASDSDITVSDVGVFEVIDGVSLRSAKLTENELSSVTYQLCMALLMAQEVNGFVHNDLHWKNVLLTKCDPNLHISYVYRRMDGTRSIFKRTVPTHGYIPVIIDYGFAYCNELAHEQHNPEVLYADHIGYVTYETDKVVDILRTLLEYNSLCRLPADLMCRIKSCIKQNGRIRVGENSAWYNFETRLTRLMQSCGVYNFRRRGYLLAAIKRCIRLPLDSKNVKLIRDDPSLNYELSGCVSSLVMALKHVDCPTIATFVGFIRDCSDTVRVRDPRTASHILRQRYAHIVTPGYDADLAIYSVCVAFNNVNYYSTRDLEANASLLRTRRQALWKRIGTGEDLFMAAESSLFKSCTSQGRSTRINDPVLVIDSARRQNRFTAVKPFTKNFQ